MSPKKESSDVNKIGSLPPEPDNPVINRDAEITIATSE